MSSGASETETVMMLVYAEALPSIVCIVFHLWKFYRSSGKQSLVTKNLTLYCFFLLFPISFIISPLYFDPTTYLHVQYLDVYMVSLTMFFKFIIVAEISQYFYRNPYPQRPPSDSDPRNDQFRKYCIIGIITPLVYTLALRWVSPTHEGVHYDPFDAVFPTLKIMRIANLIPIFGTVWLLRSFNIDRSELLAKYPVQIRLLMTIGAQSILISLAELMYSIFTTLSYEVTNDFENIAIALEGVVIAILFTFREDTFQPVGSGELVSEQ